MVFPHPDEANAQRQKLVADDAETLDEAADAEAAQLNCRWLRTEPYHPIDDVGIARDCTVPWNNMDGAPEIRKCHACKLNVLQPRASAWADNYACYGSAYIADVGLSSGRTMAAAISLSSGRTNCSLFLAGLAYVGRIPFLQ